MITLLRNAELYDPAPCGRRHLVVGGEQVLWSVIVFAEVLNAV